MSAPQTAIVYVKDEIGGIHHWSANNLDLAEAAKRDCRKWLSWVRRHAYKGHKPCGKCQIVVELS